MKHNKPMNSIIRPQVMPCTGRHNMTLPHISVSLGDYTIEVISKCRRCGHTEHHAGPFTSMRAAEGALKRILSAR